MKKISLILLIALLAAPLASMTTNARHIDPSQLKFEAPAFSWSATTFDFGKIKFNNPVSHEFKFSNSGTTPLVISTVQASCGCTVTAYTKEPIPPGGEGFVKATYDAAKLGSFNKTVTVNANAGEGVVRLTIKGEVVGD
jgi:hypothetical protein